MCCMSCWCGLLSPAGEALAGVEAEDMGVSGIVLPPAEGGGARGVPKDPRLRKGREGPRVRWHTPGGGGATRPKFKNLKRAPRVLLLQMPKAPSSF